MFMLYLASTPTSTSTLKDIVHLSLADAKGYVKFDTFPTSTYYNRKGDLKGAHNLRNSVAYAPNAV